MQQGSRNRTSTRTQRENTNEETPTVRSCQKNKDDVSSFVEMDRSASVLSASESPANCFNASTEERIQPKRELVTDCGVLQRLGDVHSFCILGKYYSFD
jgi:hypothetical protein